MPKATKQHGGSKSKLYALPATQRKKDFGIPKLQSLKASGRQAMPLGSNRPPSTQALSNLAASLGVPEAGPSTASGAAPIDASLTTRDSSSKAFMRELRKVIEKSDVIIQVLDARDPEGTRSRWVEEEVRKREADGKKLLAVVNKIDLVPRANLEGWLRHLRHSFACMPFKSSTQTQRQNLSQNLVPLSQTSTKVGEKAVYTELPTTSSSLGAPALLHLLKQYSLSTPHSSLTVGVVGYPNVGKSSLINSLKRSRACAVAAMPGKTRVTQEVVLDKGVKIIDCPGVVLEDIGRDNDAEDGRRKQAEIMLRNCIKAELVEDPIAPIEVILTKTDPSLLRKIYNLPDFDGVRDFLIKLALTRGRLGKGGIPDLEGAAVSVLRDWNSGKIPYHTIPPQHHASSAPLPVAPASGDIGMEGEAVGDAKILNTLSEAFTLDGLFDDIGNGGEWQGEDANGKDGGGMIEDEDLPAAVPAVDNTAQLPSVDAFAAAAASSDGESEADFDHSDDENVPAYRRPLASKTVTIAPSAPRTVVHPDSSAAPSGPSTNTTKLFSQAEMALLPADIFDRQKAKQAAKKAKKRKAEQERTEGELMYGVMGMDVDERQPESVRRGGAEGGEKVMWMNKKSKKEKRKDKARRMRERAVVERAGMQMDEDLDAGASGAGVEQKEADFAKFLQGVGADSDEEL